MRLKTQYYIIELWLFISKFIVENCDVDFKNFNYEEYLNSRTDSFKHILIKEYLKTKKI